MAESFRMIKDGWDMMNSGGQYMGVFLAAVLFLFIVETPKNKQLFTYCVLTMFLLWNPLTGWFLINCFGFEGAYQQAFLLLPLIPVCAYCCVQAVRTQDKKRDRILLFCSLFAVAAIAGRLMNPDKDMVRRENAYCITNEYRDFFDRVLENGENSLLLADAGIMESARAYSDRIGMPYEVSLISQDESVWQQYYGADLKILYDDMKKPVNRLGGITTTARRYGCNYLILPIEADDRTAMENGGYRVLEETEGYVLYRDTSIPD